ncbi:V-type ATP synthase subunit I [Halobacterium rubrum]|uniref:hypothetical protein n=1 Tax=Halobacterium TaxID=2239 RepID=UPI001F171FD0|nr:MULTISPECIES: hypothetical protein [Halobacterium]MDH5020351.1 hypothetical protein [Halobacterium rubrum]
MAVNETKSGPEPLAKKYLDALNHEIDEERRAVLEDRLSELRQRREKFVEQHGEDSGIVQRVDRKILDVEDELDALKQSAQQVDELREDLLKAAAEDFEFDSTWLSPTVLNGLTHALYGKEEDSLILDQNRIENTDDLNDIGDIEQLDMEHTLLTLSEDRLDRTDRVKKRWERLVDSKKYTPFLVVAREGSASPEDVLPELDDDANRKNAKNWLESPIYDWDELVPYYRAGNGQFALSTVGKYLAEHYAGDFDDDHEDEVDDGTDGGNGDGQASLDDIDGGEPEKSDE